MSQPTEIQFQETDLETIAQAMGRVALIIDPEAGRSPCARRINRLTKGALDRALGSEAFGKLKAGDTMELAYPAGMECEALSLVVLPKKTGVIEARKAGAAIGKSLTETGALVLAENHARAAEISFGLALKAYRFEPYLSEAKPAVGAVVFAVSKPEEVAAKAAPLAALAEGVFFTRDLVNEPANILTTDDFAGRDGDIRRLSTRATAGLVNQKTGLRQAHAALAGRTQEQVAQQVAAAEVANLAVHLRRLQGTPFHAVADSTFCSITCRYASSAN